MLLALNHRNGCFFNRFFYIFSKILSIRSFLLPFSKTINRSKQQRYNTMTLAKEDPSGTVNDVIKKIVGSKLGDTEKLLLAIEWILREYTVYDLFEMSPAEMKRVVKLRLENFFADDYINSTLTLAKKTVNLSKDKNALIFLIALAYFLYIDDEFVYDVVTREQLFSKEK